MCGFSGGTSRGSGRSGQNLSATLVPSLLCVCMCSEGKSIHQGVFSSGNSSASTGNSRGLVYQKACFQGKKEENTYTPRASKLFVGNPFAQCWCIDLGLLYIYIYMCVCVCVYVSQGVRKWEVFVLDTLTPKDTEELTFRLATLALFPNIVREIYISTSHRKAPESQFWGKIKLICWAVKNRMDITLDATHMFVAKIGVIHRCALGRMLQINSIFLGICWRFDL